MSPRYAYFYLMRDEPDRVHAIVPEHVSHWRGVELKAYLGGPFADNSGGLITFEADDVAKAAEMVGADPFVTEGLLGWYWLKEWIPE